MNASETSHQADQLMHAILNLARFHRDHEKFYSSAPREQAVLLQRHARTLQALADRWSTAERSERSVLSPFEAAEDLNAPDAVQLDGVLFLEGEGRPPEITRLIRDLRTLAEDALSSGEWLAAAMEASWATAAALLPMDGFADVLGERHRIIANDWRAAGLTTLAGRLLERAAEILDGVDFTPAALRADLDGRRTSAMRLYSAAEMIGHAADLSSDAAGAEHDSERRWRTFRSRAEEIVQADR
ncbi:hypothetical protein [Catenulispora subtropica]|uniref:Uncharacterized protein n=1 Tax=Catenulispora subtropica TaxID=450798 RepID=A0ABN2RL40_9ACTN